MRFIKRINELSDNRIDFLWDFFIEAKDDGLDVNIDYSSDRKLIVVKIKDPLEIYGHLYVLEHKKEMREMIDRLLSIDNNIISSKLYTSDKSLILYIRVDKLDKII
jgi:hypothetical protein